MKKLVFVFVIMLGVSVASCGYSTSKNTEIVDSVEVINDSVDTVAIDTAAVDSVL